MLKFLIFKIINANSINKIDEWHIKAFKKEKLGDATIDYLIYRFSGNFSKKQLWALRLAYGQEALRWL